MIGAQLLGPRHPGLERVVRGLEAQHEQRPALGGGLRERRLARVEQAAVRGVQAGLGERPHRAGARLEGVEQHAPGLLEAGRRLHAHPGLGDHPEDPLGPDQEAVGAGPRAGGGQAAALPGPARSERPDGLHEVVDVRVQRGVVPPGPGGDPAAERRVLERLGEVTQGQPVPGELGLEPRAGGAGLDPGGARHRVHLEHTVQRAQVDRHRSGVLARHPRLHPAHHAGPAAERNRGGAGLLAPGQHPFEVGLVGRVSHHVRRMVEAAPEAPAPGPGTSGRTRAGRARRDRCGRGPRARTAARAGAPAAPGPPTVAATPAAPDRSRGDSRAAAAVCSICSGAGCWSSKPQPQNLRRRVAIMAG